MTAFFFLSFLKPEKVQQCAVTKRLKPVKAHKQRSSVPTLVPWNDCIVVPSHTHTPIPHSHLAFQNMCVTWAVAQTLWSIPSPSLNVTRTAEGVSVIASTFSFHCVFISVGLLHKHCCLFFHQAWPWHRLLEAVLSLPVPFCFIVFPLQWDYCTSTVVFLLLSFFISSPNVTWTTAGHSVIFSTFSCCCISVAVGLLHQHCGLLLHQTWPSRALRHLLGHQKQWGQ